LHRLRHRDRGERAFLLELRGAGGERLEAGLRGGLGFGGCRLGLDATGLPLQPRLLLLVFRTLLFLSANTAVFVSAHGNLGLG
jgi:hypothetical protein